MEFIRFLLWKNPYRIENPTKEDYREIFKKLDIIAEDILEEESEQILQDIKRIIKKQAVLNIKEYVEKNLIIGGYTWQENNWFYY